MSPASQICLVVESPASFDRVTCLPPKNASAPWGGVGSRQLTIIVWQVSYVQYLLACQKSQWSTPYNIVKCGLPWKRVSAVAILGGGWLQSPASDGPPYWRYQAKTWTYDESLSIGPLVTNLSETLIRIPKFSFQKMHLKKPSAKLRPFCSGINVLRQVHLIVNNGQRGPCNPYKPCNHNLYIGINIFPHIDDTQSTGYN